MLNSIEDGEDISALNAPFPIKLYVMMHSTMLDTNAITWINDGKAFKIIDPELFASKVVPRYFKHAKLTSFQRQLNLYGFRRITKGEDQGAYCHTKFVQNRHDLLDGIRRVATKSALSANNNHEMNMAQSLRPPFERSHYGTRSSSGATPSDSYERLGGELGSGLEGDRRDRMNPDNTSSGARDRQRKFSLSKIHDRNFSHHHDVCVNITNSSDSSETMSGIKRVRSNSGNNMGHNYNRNNTADKVECVSSSSGENSIRSGDNFTNSDNTTPIMSMVSLPKALQRMSKITMNIGFGRDIRQGQLQPPVKRRTGWLPPPSVDYTVRESSSDCYTDRITDNHIQSDPFRPYRYQYGFESGLENYYNATVSAGNSSGFNIASKDEQFEENANNGIPIHDPLQVEVPNVTIATTTMTGSGSGSASASASSNVNSIFHGSHCGDKALQRIDSGTWSISDLGLDSMESGLNDFLFLSQNGN